MTRGRKPKPVALRIVGGNAGHRPLNKREPKPRIGIPPIPAHLNEAARAEWRAIAPELRKLHILSVIDRAALAAYCESFARWGEAAALIAEQGLLISTPIRETRTTAEDGSVNVVKSGGYQIQNPLLAIAKSEREACLKYLLEFGMTPSSRSRILGDATIQPPAGTAPNDYYNS